MNTAILICLIRLKNQMDLMRTLVGTSLLGRLYQLWAIYMEKEFAIVTWNSTTCFFRQMAIKLRSLTSHLLLQWEIQITKKWCLPNNVERKLIWHPKSSVAALIKVNKLTFLLLVFVSLWCICVKIHSQQLSSITCFGRSQTLSGDNS